jgi:hypothetical protein
MKKKDCPNLTSKKTSETGCGNQTGIKYISEGLVHKT